MNKFDEKYLFRFATLHDVDNIMLFIKNEWGENHILANNKEFFLYEFSGEKHINFILAIEKSSNIIDGIIGYLPASKEKKYLDIWGVMWKITDKRKVMSFLGIELMKRLINMTKCRSEMGVGANIQTSIPVLKIALDYWVGKMKHYYMLSTKNDFRIASINNIRKTSISIYKRKKTLKRYYDIKELSEKFDLSKYKLNIPYKDTWYIDKRFFKHPIYNYYVYGIYNDFEVVEGILIGREVEYNKSKIFRIVDFIGEAKAFSGLNNSFEQLLNYYEYIDFYCYGIDDKYIKEAGFIERTENDSNIIPNYFEPFVLKNIDIWINSNIKGCCFCKADGDQDRPNYSK